MIAFVRVLIALALCFAVMPSSSGALDLNGKWRFGPGDIVVFTHSGNSLSFTLSGFAFSGTVTPGSPFSTYTVVGLSVPAQIEGRIMPSENLLDARIVSGAFPDLFASGTYARRCSCDDGNTADGDGCDAECQVEPCWTCSGDPSTCVPLAENAACEDGSPCTTGETCTAGVCGGGSAVSPCIDMSGSWFREQEIPSLDLTFSLITSFTQTGTDVVGGGLVGTINPATGDFDLRIASFNVFLSCPSGFDTLIGSVAADGQTYAAAGSFLDYNFAAPEFCDEHPVSEVGNRCGNGEIAGDEECDDGNLDDGDGCGATCAIETCWTCTGEPSSCASLPTAPCTVSTVPTRSLLVIKDRTKDAADRVIWRWKKGEEVPLASLGDPMGGDSYELCIFDESGPEPMLTFAAELPGGGLCDGVPCWATKGADGFKYKRKDGAPEGIAEARLRAGDAGKPFAIVKGRGPLLSDRTAGLPALPLATPLRVQLRGGTDLCVESEYDAAGVIKNDPANGTFKARGAQP